MVANGSHQWPIGVSFVVSFEYRIQRSPGYCCTSFSTETEKGVTFRFRFRPPISIGQNFDRRTTKTFGAFFSLKCYTLFLIPNSDPRRVAARDLTEGTRVWNGSDGNGLTRCSIVFKNMPKRSKMSLGGTVPNMR
jgi:hypothetical protein